ncbi:hypothetical protein PSHT_10868 [Puccinia striiformis]|uniref:Tet-like 2OG-Fe(II) oxygenase domain-containing protein n=1 Tax=Puccinia striiformis TaxID=27350 RepID=A0A2S4V6Y0_9BASI|nr:hypothetical protein PSHT_10868 [Puccinia striiformis]
MAITFKKATQVKYLSGRSRDSRRRKAKKQECRPLKRIARNIEHTNQAQIASHISRHDPARPVRKFKNSFVCYADDARTIVVAVVKFHPFAKMKPAEKKEYERLSTNLIGHTKFQNVNKSNGNTLGGKMFSLGWRKGYEKNNKLGITAIGSKVAKDRAGFMRLYKEIPFVNDFLASRFRDVSLKMYHQVKSHHNQLNAPSLAPLFFADPNAFCCHLSFTFDNFYNKSHKDRDASPYSFVMWIPANKKTGKLIENDLQVEGGEFVFPNDGCAIDFSGFDGVVECAWKATKHPHHTLKSTTPKGSPDTRIGISCQLPNSAKRALDRILSGKYDKKVDWTFRDARKVVADSHRYDTKGRLIKKKTNNFTYNKIGKRKKITSTSSTQLVSFNL